MKHGTQPLVKMEKRREYSIGGSKGKKVEGREVGESKKRQECFRGGGWRASGEEKKEEKKD